MAKFPSKMAKAKDSKNPRGKMLALKGSNKGEAEKKSRSEKWYGKKG
jgi:hypothetical protein